MPKREPSDRAAKRSKYERVPLAQLKQSRRGKHRGVVDQIVAELEALGDAEAMRIPLNSVQGVSLANLRSAVSRGYQIARRKHSHVFRRP